MVRLTLFTWPAGVKAQIIMIKFSCITKTGLRADNWLQGAKSKFGVGNKNSVTCEEPIIL